MIFKSIRALLGLAIVALLALLYYSNQLIESDLKALRGELASLRLRSAPLPSAPQRVATGPNLLKERQFDIGSILPAGFVPHGQLRVGEIGKPKNFHPLANYHEVRKAWDLLVPKLAELEPGSYEQFNPDLALRIEQNGGEFLIHLREGVYWQPLEARFVPGVELDPSFLRPHPVTAHDLVFYIDAVMNPHVEESGAGALRQLMFDLEEWEALDDQTVRLRWRVDPETGKPRFYARSCTFALRPLPRWLYQRFADGSNIVDDSEPHTYRHNSIWAQNFGQHWAKNLMVGCGAWHFDGGSDQEIRFRRNPDHYEPLAALTDEQVWLFRESGDALWQEFKAGGLDIFDAAVAPEKVHEQLPEETSRLDFPRRQFRYVGWNQSSPYFQSKRVRRALTMAIDRPRLIEQIYQGMAMETTGNGFPLDANYDSSIEPHSFDPEAARALLAEEGWIDSDGDGVVDKLIDGRREKFSFSLIYYVKSMANRLIADYLATCFREIGVECRPVGLDIADFSAAVDGHDFEAMTMSWILGTPPADHRQLWHSSGAGQKGSSNLVDFRHEEADRLIDQLDFEDDLDRRRTLYHSFHRLMHEEQPYTFLAISRVPLFYKNRVHNVMVPSQRPDLFPGSSVAEPTTEFYWVD